MSLVHWDDAPEDDLALAAGAGWACLRRLVLTPGGPLHLDADDRETVVWTLDRDAVLVRRPGDVERSIRAEGTLDVLVFAVDAPPADHTGEAHSPGVVRPASLEGERVVDGQTAIVRYDVGSAAGAVGVGVELVEVAPNRRSFPVLDLDQLSVVLRGSGQVVLDGAEPWVMRGSVVSQGERFTAGPQGLRVLTFRENPQPAGPSS
ncbi:MAG: hypothetical protein JWO90_1815 [Solirubrobacterales bacterium]|nr:hypothetical protein [Solirubrobacterales bacterium]